ncbi:gametogenetin-binding protein 2-like [Artemia franciscana]|uniref:gametogenetin-binding protein 2-like n=1 Tax=Artemia franciscana TaxID=6661 RepID=UPI0032DB4D22
MLLCATLAAMRMSLDVTLEQKRGVSELELLCEELTKEEEVAQQRREQKRLKRRKRKGKKGETASGNNEEVEENPGDNDTEEEALVPPPSSIECKVRKPSPLKSKNSLKQEVSFILK